MASSPRPPRVTELPNPLTAELDAAAGDARALVRLLSVADATLFTGSHGLPGVHDAGPLAAAGALSRAAAAALGAPGGAVLLAGCGTSGRLAHLLARGLGAAAAAAGLPGRVDYLLAGGDTALLIPSESVEDRADAPLADLAAWEAARAAGGPGGADDAPAPPAPPGAPVLVVGISAGLSATYVGALLEEVARRGGAWTAAAVGFNAAGAVEGVRVGGWAGSFHAVLGALPAAGGIVLNPVAGPEAVAGSSRMKAGSLTKVVLEPALAAAVAVAAAARAAPPGGAGRPPLAPSAAELSAWLRDAYLGYERAVRVTYAAAGDDLARVVAAAGAALTTRVPPLSPPPGAAAPPGRAPPAGGGFASPTGRGRIVYVGAGVAGVLGLIDASECTPTYGALFNDVRAFVVGGWAAVAPRGGPPPPIRVPAHVRADGPGARAELVRIDVDAGFREDVLPTLGPADVVVGLSLPPGAREGDAGARDDAAVVAGCLAAARAAGAVTTYIAVDGDDARADAAARALDAAASLRGVRLRLPAARWAPGAGALYRGDRGEAEEAAASSGDGGSAGGGGGAGAGAAPVEGAPRGRLPAVFAELALKLCLNAVTTGAHVIAGAVHGNRMVNVLLTNAKLLARAVGIVADVALVPRDAAHDAVLRAVHSLDARDGAALAAARAEPAGDTVAAASGRLGLVPLAVLLAAAAARPGREPLALADAAAALEAEPVVRAALARLGLSG